MMERRRENINTIYLVILFLFVFYIPSYATFSIVAMDPETEEWGVAVSSKVPDVGYIVPWIEAGVGAVATQAYSNPYFGPWALEVLSEGKSADEALAYILEKDTVPERRQVGIVDKDGNSAAHTGKENNEWAGNKTATYVSVQGNILAGGEVVDSMFEVFQRTEGILGERLLRAIEAGEDAGGDRRGKQSAALYVMRKRGGYLGVDDRLVDLKVLDNPEPVKELRRLFNMWKYLYIAPAYLRLAEEEEDRADMFFKKTYSLLLMALESDLNDPNVYNNLAWEFAIRKKYPEETLKAAKKAYQLTPEEANIMDTLAEAYFAIGNYEKAVFYEKKALEKEPDNEFFKKQLDKFQKALRK
jgi:uncharacterized Ntn-hydrolase superfamily protein